MFARLSLMITCPAPMKLLSLVSTFLALAFLPAHAQSDREPTPKEIAAAQKAMKAIGELEYQKGEISLIGGKAKIRLTDDFRYLDPANARKVLVDIWHNPPGSGSNTLGMIVPKDVKFFSPDSWVATLKWTEEGYVKDEEFDSMDFNEILAKLKEASKEESKERVRQGYGKIELADWAQAPHYDKKTHKLYWAKAFNVDGPEQQLNYDIRFLGRAGVIEVSIMSGMSQMKEIEAKAPTILSMVDFTEGNRYTDYTSGDKVATYGIAGLITGGVLAKTGFFKVLLLGLAKAWKPVVLVIGLIGVGIAKLLGRRKQL
jgi:uncharacterized membrane-anchored protein